MSPDDERIRSGALSRICTDSYQRDAEFVMPSNHCHAYYEIYYLEQGACRFFLGDTMLDLHSGDGEAAGCADACRLQERLRQQGIRVLMAGHMAVAQG